MPFLVAFSFLAAVSSEAERPVIFVYPSFSHWEQAARRRGGGGRTGLRALQQAFVNGPQLPGRPRRADSRWLDTVVSGPAVARQEEAFFWPENNARVSLGTSLLHPLPSIVSQHTIPGRLALHKQEGGGTGPGEISNVYDTSRSASASQAGPGFWRQHMDRQAKHVCVAVGSLCFVRGCQQCEATDGMAPRPPRAHTES